MLAVVLGVHQLMTLLRALGERLVVDKRRTLIRYRYTYLLGAGNTTVAPTKAGAADVYENTSSSIQFATLTHSHSTSVSSVSDVTLAAS